jgi:hypothetical protein
MSPITPEVKPVLPGAWQAADGYWYEDRHRQDADGNWHSDGDPPGYHHGGVGPCPRTYDEMVYRLEMERWGAIRDAYKAANPERWPPSSEDQLFMTGAELAAEAEVDEMLIACGELPPMPDEPPEWEDAVVILSGAMRRNDNWNCYEPLATAADRSRRHQPADAPAPRPATPKMVNPKGWRVPAPIAQPVGGVS